MKVLLRQLAPVVLAALWWMGVCCCGYAMTLDPVPTLSCPSGKAGLTEKPRHNTLPVPTAERSRAGYERAIGRIEAESGAFAYKLVPELVGLGMLDRERRENARAATTFRRAFFIVRMHQGLNTLSQIPVLEMLIKTNSDRGHWKEVADEYDLLYWVYRRNYSDADPRLLPVLKRLRQWNLGAYDKDTGRSLDQHFRAARALYNKTVAILKACGADEKLARCYLGDDCCNGGGPGRADCPAQHS